MTITSKRRLLGLDINGKRVDARIGGNNGPLCKYCGSYQATGLHWSDCALFKIRLSVLNDVECERIKRVRKNANKQIIFHQERPNTTSKQRFRRKLSTKPRRSVNGQSFPE